MQGLQLKLIQGESQTVEFKFELNSARRIAATLSAFANTDGGTLLVGVKDNGSVAGIRLEEELYVLDAAATMYCNPAVILENRRHEVQGKMILESVVKPVLNRPVLAETEPGNWKAWVRYGASNRLASLVHLELWKMDENSKRPSVYSTKEQKLIAAFQLKKWLTLNQAVKLTKMPRYAVVRTLASFVRWDIAEMIPEDAGGFSFSLLEDDF
jgi:predicted HTH transcriptional regulator